MSIHQISKSVSKLLSKADQWPGLLRVALRSLVSLLSAWFWLFVRATVLFAFIIIIFGRVVVRPLMSLLSWSANAADYAMDHPIVLCAVIVSFSMWVGIMGFLDSRRILRQSWSWIRDGKRLAQ